MAGGFIPARLFLSRGGIIVNQFRFLNFFAYLIFLLFCFVLGVYTGPLWGV